MDGILEEMFGAKKLEKDSALDTVTKLTIERMALTDTRFKEMPPPDYTFFHSLKQICKNYMKSMIENIFKELIQLDNQSSVTT
jgi:hypothetical protein